jgi:hypothetical protein
LISRASSTIEQPRTPRQENHAVPYLLPAQFLIASQQNRPGEPSFKKNLVNNVNSWTIMHTGYTYSIDYGRLSALFDWFIIS